jgi:hypothetical protein
MQLRIHPRFLTLLALAVLVLAVSCSSSATPVPHTPTTAPKAPTVAPKAPTAAPTNTPAATAPTKAPATAVPTTVASAATAAPVATTAPVAPTAVPATLPAGTIDLNKILPAGPGRDLFLNNCTSCHAFVCSVEGQRTADNWGTIQANHVDKLAGLSEADYKAVFAYLVTNFNDKTPAPKLPPELAGMVCSAQ